MHLSNRFLGYPAMSLGIQVHRETWLPLLAVWGTFASPGVPSLLPKAKAKELRFRLRYASLLVMPSLGTEEPWVPQPTVKHWVPQPLAKSYGWVRLCSYDDRVPQLKSQAKRYYKFKALFSPLSKYEFNNKK